MNVSGPAGKSIPSNSTGITSPRRTGETQAVTVADVPTVPPASDTGLEGLQDGFSASTPERTELLGGAEPTGGAVAARETVPARSVQALLSPTRTQPAAALSMAPVNMPGKPPPGKGVSFPFRVDLRTFIAQHGRNPTADEVLTELNAQYRRRHPGAADQVWKGGPPSPEVLKQLIQNGSIVINVEDGTVKPPDAKKAAEQQKYLQGLGGEEKAWLDGEADRQYAEKTQNGSKPTTPEDKAYRDALKQELLRRHEALKALPPHLREFLLKDASGMEWDEEAAGRVARKLAGFSPDELADYLSKTTGTTTDWGKLEESLDTYRKHRAERTEGAQRLEDLKTRLHTPVELYAMYKQTLDLGARVERTNHGAPMAEQSLRELTKTLNEQLPLYGFSGIPAFRDAISDFKASFEKETLALGMDTLREHEHVLFAAERKYEDTSGLYQDLRQARELLARAKQLDETASAIESPPNAAKSVPQGNAPKLRQESSALRFQAERLLGELTAKHPVLMDGKFAAALARAPQREFKGMLREHLAARRQDIAATRAELQRNPRFVYQLDQLLSASRAAHRIQPGSLHAAILDDHVAGLRTEELKLSALTAAVCIGAGLLSGGGGTLAGAAAFGAFAFGAYEAKQAFQQYELERAAHGARLLSTEPSFGWVLLAVAGAAFDLGAAAKSLKVLGAMKNAVRDFNASHDLARLDLRLKALPEVTPEIHKRVMEAARNEVQQRQHLEGLLSRGGPLQVGATPDARLGELTQVARSLAEKGDESFDTFLKELRDGKLLQGEPSPQSLQRLKEVYSEGVNQARQARKATALQAEQDIAQKLDAPRQAPVTKEPVKTKPLQRPQEPVRIEAPRRDVEAPMKEVARLQQRFSADELSRADFHGGLMRALEKAGGDPKVATALRRLRDRDEGTFHSAFGGQPPGVLLRLASSKDPLLVNYAERLIQNATAGRLLSTDLSRALSDAERLAKLPSPVDAKNVTNGSGGVGTFYEGKVEGLPTMFKTEKRLDSAMTLDQEERVLKGLKPYGAPEYRGRYRVQDPETGVWRETVAMEKVDGMDLQRMLNLRAEGAPLPFPVTDKHLKALQALEERLRSEGKHFDEVNFGDFILTQDPNRPIVPVDMFVKPGIKSNSGMTGKDSVPVRQALQSLVGPASRP